MRYGLQFEDNDTITDKKWRITMEHNLDALKEEVSVLKQKFQASLGIIDILLSNKELTKVSKDVKTGDDNATLRNGFAIFQEKQTVFANPPRVFFCSPTIYRRTLWSDPLDQQGFKSLTCISAMPEYENLSMEEIRWNMYNAANPTTSKSLIINNNGLDSILSGSRRNKYSPKVFLEEQKVSCLHCITCTSPYQNKSLEELRLEDYILNEVPFFIQNSSKDMGNNNCQSNQKQEDLLSVITSQVGKLNTDTMSIDSKLSIMNNNLIGINLQMSIMDSRMSAIEMFVTTQGMDQNWQRLTTRLNELAYVKTNKKLPTDEQIRVDSTLLNKDIKLEASSTSKEDVLDNVTDCALEATINMTSEPSNQNLKSTEKLQKSNDQSHYISNNDQFEKMFTKSITKNNNENTPSNRSTLSTKNLEKHFDALTIEENKIINPPQNVLFASNLLNNCTVENTYEQHVDLDSHLSDPEHDFFIVDKQVVEVAYGPDVCDPEHECVLVDKHVEVAYGPDVCDPEHECVLVDKSVAAACDEQTNYPDNCPLNNYLNVEPFRRVGDNSNDGCHDANCPENKQDISIKI